MKRVKGANRESKRNGLELSLPCALALKAAEYASDCQNQSRAEHFPVEVKPPATVALRRTSQRFWPKQATSPVDCVALPSLWSEALYFTPLQSKHIQQCGEAGKSAVLQRCRKLPHSCNHQVSLTLARTTDMEVLIVCEAI